jgi:hypothetical protein
LYLICLIFNGNIRTPGKLQSFNEFLNSFNQKIKDRARTTGKLKELGLTLDIFQAIEPVYNRLEIILNDP